MFDKILGNEPIKSYFNRALKEDRLPQTMLFIGIDGIGKSLFAKQLAKHLLKKDCSPDFHLLRAEGKSGLYSISALKQMIDRDHAAPFEGVGKVFVLEDAHRMQIAAANALLKILEEPARDSTYILLTDTVHEILPTILSRCTCLNFQPLKLAEIEMFLHKSGYPIHLAKFAYGSLKRAFELVKYPEFEKLRKHLFELLKLQPPYPQLVLELNQLEKVIGSEKETDPIHFVNQVEHLFALILMWHRDQHLKKVQAKKELLFFPDEEEKEPLPLEPLLECIDRARFAFSRNMRLSHCLIEVFLTMRALSAGLKNTHCDEDSLV